MLVNDLLVLMYTFPSSHRWAPWSHCMPVTGGGIMPQNPTTNALPPKSLPSHRGRDQSQTQIFISCIDQPVLCSMVTLAIWREFRHAVNRWIDTLLLTVRLIERHLWSKYESASGQKLTLISDLMKRQWHFDNEIRPKKKFTYELILLLNFMQR